jgi:hypothetical protein
VEDGFEKAAPEALPRCLRGLQTVAQRHQFIDLGDDATLFDDWRQRKQCWGHSFQSKASDRRAFHETAHLIIEKRRTKKVND